MLASKDARMCSHIVDELPLAQSTVSEHLRILRSAGLVQVNDSGPRAGWLLAALDRSFVIGRLREASAAKVAP